MPFKSKAQAGAMHAAAEGNSTLGIPKAVGKEFVHAGHGQEVGKLPARKGHKPKQFTIERKKRKAKL